MAIRLTGLASGLDTDSMVKELVSAYSKKLEGYEKDKTKLEWKQEAWSTMNTKIYGFYTGALSSMRMTSSFASKKSVTVSDPTKATVSASGSVANGTQNVEIKKMASAGYLTGSKIATEAGEKATANSTMEDFGIKEPGAFSFTVGGESKTVSFSSTDTLRDVLGRIKEETGLRASFDENNQRIILSSESGKENDFTVSAFSEDGLKNLSKLGLLSKDSFGEYTKYLNRVDYNKELEEYNAKVDAYAESDEYKEYQNKLNDYNSAMQEYSVKKAAYEQYLGMKQQMEEAGDTEGLAQLEAVEDPGAEPVKPELPDNHPGNPPVKGDAYSAEEIEKKLGIKSYATKQDASDALIVVNGAEFESSSNSITVNGLTINATGVTNGAISVTTSTDKDGIYNMIKDFVKEYNSVINEMTKLYGAKTAKGYEPLTDEEKDEMSEKEVEKWENKIKESLLRRDDKLNSIMSSFNLGVQKAITIGGKSYNLSFFGIHTQSIISAKTDEHNALHIDGDKDDSATADAADKLKQAIEKDPDTVMEFFTQLAKGIYSDLTEKMKSTSLSSAYTVYNDKQMKDDMKKIENNISSWEKKVKDYEEKWYKQFSKMETALSELQNQTNSLTSLLGS